MAELNFSLLGFIFGLLQACELYVYVFENKRPQWRLPRINWGERQASNIRGEKKNML